jgi:hypothetical protein
MKKMVNKKKVGCFQFWIGIILLIIAVVGIIVSIISYNNLRNYATNVDLNIPNDISEEEKLEFIQLRIINVGIQTSARFSLVQSLAIATIVIFLMSILFITQGLINKSEVSK